MSEGYWRYVWMVGMEALSALLLAVLPRDGPICHEAVKIKLQL